MLKNISNLGSVLNKSEQKSINGGLQYSCDPSRPTPCASPIHLSVECIGNRCVYSDITPF
ncbi:hypothetical protein [Tenacibaculum sp. Bg11-29]|uniref:hypothetical protein n=1 Tax=Tenacibaculum sp. Bg11-29 TaxID=2058306 RepID=UPI0012FEA7C0|nr:hypothetical protein [Tenacibaculum sp. Bg11-29]